MKLWHETKNNMQPQGLINKLDKREMISCEVCHGFHTIEESEVITIRIVKGKKCDINERFARPAVVSATPFPAGLKLPDAPPPIRRPIIPPGMAQVMIPPGDPLFESHGAKEKRQV